MNPLWSLLYRQYDAYTYCTWGKCIGGNVVYECSGVMVAACVLV